MDLLKTKLWIVFDGETGLDYGGVARYVNMTEELLDISEHLKKKIENLEKGSI